ncbi:hypothetical protein [Actinomadura sp. GTD37]|uniref:hypothetical protein n=1 Tax=Actinomadura sp. GTD37 TaxID=1778030 RepID=UPI0035C1073B
MIRVLVAYASERGGTAEIADWVGAALRLAGVEAEQTVTPSPSGSRTSSTATSGRAAGMRAGLGYCRPSSMQVTRFSAQSAQDRGTALAGSASLLVSGVDAPADWLCAGQALEVPELRTFIEARFCSGAHPQTLLRPGVPEGAELGTVRRPAAEVVEER